MHQGFNYTKEFPKYTKENMPADRFGSHFSQNGTINVISRPDCQIFNYLRYISDLDPFYVSKIYETPLKATRTDGETQYLIGFINKTID